MEEHKSCPDYLSYAEELESSLRGNLGCVSAAGDLSGISPWSPHWDISCVGAGGDPSGVSGVSERGDQSGALHGEPRWDLSCFWIVPTGILAVFREGIRRCQMCRDYDLPPQGGE